MMVNFTILAWIVNISGRSYKSWLDLTANAKSEIKIFNNMLIKLSVFSQDNTRFHSLCFEINDDLEIHKL